MKIESYEPSLGPFAPSNSIRGAGRKAKWAVGIAAEVNKLRSVVAAKVLSINLLLATQTSQTVSQIDTRVQKEHKDLLTRIEEHRSRLGLVHDAVHGVKKDIIEASLVARLDARKQLEMSAEMQNNMKALADNASQSVGLLQNLSSTTGLLRSSLVSLKTVVGAFPVMLQHLLQTNVQIYQILLQLKNSSICANPTTRLSSNIKFIDALGRPKELPYEWFCHWEPFEGFIRAEFKNVPGERKVMENQYHLVDMQRQGALIKPEDWNRSVFPGSKIQMSIILSLLRRQGSRCPRPSCGAPQAASIGSGGFVTCQSCSLNFCAASTDLEGHFGRVSVLEDEEQVSIRQAEEDLELYGRRIPPAEIKDSYYDGNDPVRDDMLRVARKRGAIELHSGIQERPVKLQKVDASETLSELHGKSDPAGPNITAIDWNSGDSPLEAWLNQSVFPPAISVPEIEERDKALGCYESLELESEEIKFFRNVHLCSAPEPVKQERTAVDLDTLEGLDFGAQIYYRNILDRYPLIPDFLAIRLAQANYRRAERLQAERLRAGKTKDRHSSPSEPSMHEYGVADHRLEDISPTRPDLQMSDFYVKEADRWLPIANVARVMRRALPDDAKIQKDAKECMQECVSEFVSFVTSEAQMRASEEKRKPLNAEDLLVAMERLGFENYAEALKIYLARYRMDQSSFWDRSRSQRSRPGSVHTRASSRNSSLRGFPKFDPSEQNPTFVGVSRAEDEKQSSSNKALNPPAAAFTKANAETHVRADEDIFPKLWNQTSCNDSALPKISDGGLSISAIPRTTAIPDERPAAVDQKYSSLMAQFPPVPRKMGPNETPMVECDVCGHTVMVRRRRQWQ